MTNASTIAQLIFTARSLPIAEPYQESTELIDQTMDDAPVSILANGSNQEAVTQSLILAQLTSMSIPANESNASSSGLIKQSMLETNITDSTVPLPGPSEYLRGIVNESATCYLSVALHFVFSISEFRTLIATRSDSISRSINSVYLALCDPSKQTAAIDASGLRELLGLDPIIADCAGLVVDRLLEHVDQSIFQVESTNRVTCQNCKKKLAKLTQSMWQFHYTAKSKLLLVAL